MEKKNLSDEDLIQLAIKENKLICVSPETYDMIEKRGLGRELQHRINPNIAYGAYTRTFKTH